uniref:Uncharacterized protein n=1 Tax=Romanomermis culicivorax TaxID=13658 RepID=A0A915IMS0_ROMCU
MEGRLHEFKNITSLAEFVNKLKADTTVWKEFSEDQENGEDDRLNGQDSSISQQQQIPPPQQIVPPPPAFQAPVSQQDIMKM